jgi:Zn-dependent protease
MFPTHQGSLRLFRFIGINVWLHWTWGILAVYALSNRQHLYSSPWWNLAETVGLFGIVLLHEFGHALACRQTGGQADQIVLWPFGGVAYVQAPPRPGAQLWSIVAGPLVNVVLWPVILGLGWLLGTTGVAPDSADFWQWLSTLYLINIVLLIFNLLPVYPLDGGQILRSLLWFKFGPRRSLLYASGVGLVGAVGLLALALSSGSLWLGVLVLLLGSHCWQAFKAARSAGNPG